MATLATPIPDLVFPWEIDRLTFKSTTDVGVKLVLGGSTLLEAALTPTEHGTAMLYGLARLITDNLPTPYTDPQTLEVEINGTVAATTTVHYNRHLGSVRAEDFAPRSFLTPASGATKTTTASSTEHLAWIAGTAETGEETLSVEAVWYAPLTMEVRPVEQTVKASGAGDIDTADVSPSVLTPPDDLTEWRLAAYTVSLNRRTISYTLATDGTAAAPATEVRFINAYGQEDTFLFLGQTEEEIKPTYSAATVDGLYRNYRIEAQPTVAVATGALSPAGERLFADLLTSPSIVRTADNAGLALTDSSFKPSNAWNASPSGTATFRETATGMRLDPVTAADTFDSSFDSTYQ